MRQKFFTNTIQGRFIKSLLSNTYLPIYNTVRVGDYIIKGFVYVYKKSLVRCKQSGYFGKDGKVDVINHYNFGEVYPKYSELFRSSYGYYDTETHEWLGKYLRCYRDIYDVNLMAFYNCFSGSYFPNVVIRDSGVITTVTKNYKVAKVPIKFNKKYTIAVDCSADVLIAPAVISKGNLTTVVANGTEINLTAALGEGNVVRKNNLTFKTPLIYELENKNPDKEGFYQRYERDLYLLIQLPQDNYSSLVVLEGDYSKATTNLQKIINAEELNQLSDNEVNALFINSLSLLQLNDGNTYPFADRLMEYLLWNTISHMDDIGQNIERTQQYAYKFDINAQFIPGVWSHYLRYLLFMNFNKDKKSTHLDNLGFVDKDVEKFLQRGGR